jgi:hypothetical protein
MSDLPDVGEDSVGKLLEADSSDFMLDQADVST